MKWSKLHTNSCLFYTLGGHYDHSTISHLHLELQVTMFLLLSQGIFYLVFFGEYFNLCVSTILVILNLQLISSVCVSLICS